MGQAGVIQPTPDHANTVAVVWRSAGIVIGPAGGIGDHGAGASWPAIGNCAAPRHRLLGLVGHRADDPSARLVVPGRLCCGRCARCLSGLSVHCGQATAGMDLLSAALRARPAGEAQNSGTGTPPERCEIPSGSASSLPPAWAGIADDAAAVAGLIAEALAARHALDTPAEAFITIIGEGAPAVLTALVLRASHPRVRLLADRPATLSLAERLAVRARRGLDVGRRADQAAVIDAGGGDPLSSAAMLLPRGQYLMLPGATPPQPAELAWLLAIETRLLAPRPAPMAEALALLGAGTASAGAIDAGPFISQRLRPADLSTRADGTIEFGGGHLPSATAEVAVITFPTHPGPPISSAHPPRTGAAGRPSPTTTPARPRARG